MNRYLILLRHAEAERDDAGGDINRHLTPRGTKSIALLGGNLRARNERVQKIYSSTATRAAQTARGVCRYLGYAGKNIVWEKDLYLASSNRLLDFLAACPDSCERILLVGHNPGLQNLLRHLATAESLPTDSSMTTAAAAKLEIREDWALLRPACARLLYLIRP
jgi:phosphohistidine phosphatase